MSRPNETTYEVSRSGASVCLERLGGDEEMRPRGGGNQESKMEDGSDEKVRRDDDGGDDENTDTMTEDNDYNIVHATAGEVGSPLCQLANVLGATVTGIVSTNEKAAQSKEDGCYHVVM
ncbi:hypothetical protein F2Q69_00025217 [Brassica cretica]|uniref:Alcohol dehydrogenase-like C-terminal domain-containing protein n=1 Tax=Brassica cretica TaxID=69181 RepID=A0A8S9Q4V6_BRACR|nr:hypothetical protein F2Q69_00025217 [Brassica cretica]